MSWLRDTGGKVKFQTTCRRPTLPACGPKEAYRSLLRAAPRGDDCWASQFLVHGLQLIEFLEYPGPVAGVCLRRIGKVKVVVEGKNVAS